MRVGGHLPLSLSFFIHEVEDTFVVARLQPKASDDPHIFFV